MDKWKNPLSVWDVFYHHTRKKLYLYTIVIMGSQYLYNIYSFQNLRTRTVWFHQQIVSSWPKQASFFVCF